MAIILTQKDWWETVEKEWEHILNIFGRVGAPMGRNAADQWWSDGIGEAAVWHPKCLVQTLEDAKKDRDHKTLDTLFNLAWLAAPDQQYIHSWPGWSSLCDLCSERWVFYPEEQTEAIQPASK